MKPSRTRRARIGVALGPAFFSLCCGAASGPAPPPEPTPVASKAFLYVLTDLGHTITGFEVVPADGTLKATSAVTGARGMSVDPEGRWLFVSSQEETTLRTYAIDREDGSLTLLSSLDTRMGQTPPIRSVYPKATRGVVFGGFSWPAPSGSGRVYHGWVAYRVDPGTGRLAAPASPRWGLGSKTCELAVGATSDFGFGECEPYSDQHFLRTWSIEPDGRWHEASAVELPDQVHEFVVCEDKLVAVVESTHDAGISSFAVDPATGRLSSLARTVLDLDTTEQMTCGPDGLVAVGSSLSIGSRLVRVDGAGAVRPLGTLALPAGPRLAFHPSGRFLYGWREDPGQSALVTLAVAENGETRPFAETPVAGHMGFEGMIAVTRPAP